MVPAMTDVLDRDAPGEEPVLLLPDEEPAATSWDRNTEIRRGVEIAVSVIVVGGAVLFTLMQLHPGLLFSDTTPTGGDMGAHVWGPAYLRDHILPHFRLTGWSPDWYAGFPMYVFYMLPPALMVVALDVVLPYGMALKIISALGIITLPVCCWAFGKLANLRFPIPQLFSVAAVIFLFDESFQIYGGNIASTMAGEFSFSIALSIAMLYFGVLSYSMRTGRLRPLAAILFALACLCHGIVIFFVVAGSVVMFLLHLLSNLDARARAWRVVKVFVSVSVVGGLLCAFWVIPFVLLHRYGTDMFYERNNNYYEMLIPRGALDWAFTGLAAIGILGSVIRRSRGGVFLGVMSLLFGAWAVLQPQSLLWNNRLLPFMYLTRYMLAAIGVVEIGQALARLIDPDRRWLDWSFRLGVLGLASLGTWLALGMHFRVLPGGGLIVEDGKQVYAWPKSSPIFRSDREGYVKYWAKWNYEGYEAKDAYGEYYGIVNAMKDIGGERGCGRALWENGNEQNKYGTPMAMMLLPFWTDGCIGSMEGLFFEASGTTPYHFLTTSALSENSSDPVRRLRYEKGEVDKGVQYLQTLGVRYYLAYNPSIVAQADANPDLEPIGTSGPWHIYEVKGTDLVLPLTNQPVVVEGVDVRDRDPWLEVGTSWFQDQNSWDALPTADGPANWQRIEVEVVGDRPTDERYLAQVAPATPIEQVPLAPVTITDVKTGDDSISFRVDQVGVPVLIRSSYFPNWKADGADGPYRAAPNLMVVVPTSNEVTLTYGYTGTELGSYALSLLGFVGLIVMWRQGPVGLEPRLRRKRRGAPLHGDVSGEGDGLPVAGAAAVGAWAPPAPNGDEQLFLLDWDEPAPPSASANESPIESPIESDGSPDPPTAGPEPPTG
jgi:hypothetical protein